MTTLKWCTFILNFFCCEHFIISDINFLLNKYNFKLTITRSRYLPDMFFKYYNFRLYGNFICLVENINCVLCFIHIIKNHWLHVNIYYYFYFYFKNGCTHSYLYYAKITLYYKLVIIDKIMKIGFFFDCNNVA